MIRLRSVVNGAVRYVLVPSAQFERWGGRTANRGAVGLFAGLTGIYLLNLVLYSLPYTVSGYLGGGEPVPELTRPAGLASLVGELVFGFVILLLVSLYVVAVFHLVLAASMNAKGLLQTYVVLVYSSGVYLAALLSAYNWSLTRIAAGGQALVRLETDGVPSFQFSADAGLLDVGVAALVVLATGYFVYSLYLGARINHDADRIPAAAASVLSGALVGWFYVQIAVLLQLPLLDAPVHELLSYGPL